MYHFQKQGLDQSQFWLLSFSGKKGRRTGWIFVVFSPLSLFGVFFSGMGLFCRLEFERQSWLFCPRNWQKSPREHWPCNGHGCRKLFYSDRAELCAWPAHAGSGGVVDEEKEWTYFVLLNKTPKAGADNAGALLPERWGVVATCHPLWLNCTWLHHGNQPCQGLNVHLTNLQYIQTDRVFPVY